MYCLDTDIIVFHLKGNTKVNEKIKEVKSLKKEISITYITLYELYKGVYTSAKQKEDLKYLDVLLKDIDLINLSINSSDIAGKIYSKLKGNGELINDADILIASLAIANNKILVTGNIKHFGRIKELKIENWLL